MNVGQIIKARGSSPYVTVSNEIAQSDKLSLQAVGLLTRLLSLPDNWVIYKSNLYSVIKNNSKPSIDSAFKELQKHGYILSTKAVNSKTGKFMGWNHIVYHEPCVNQEEKPTSRFPEVGEIRQSENRGIYKETVLERNIKEKERGYTHGSQASEFALPHGVSNGRQELNGNQHFHASPPVGIQESEVLNSLFSDDKPKKEPRKKSKKQFVPPLIDDVRKYFFENGYTHSSADKFFKYYHVASWHDRNGSPVANWKQKAISTWFKPENELPKTQSKPYNDDKNVW